jgi:ribosome-associated protein
VRAAVPAEWSRAASGEPPLRPINVLASPPGLVLPVDGAIPCSSADTEVPMAHRTGPKGGQHIEALELVRICAEIAQDKKGREFKLLDMRTTLTITDYFLIVTGTNRRQVQAIAAEIERKMKAEGEPKPGVEGLQSGRWVLLDLDRVVVHLFDEETRGYYGLEHLWADAPEIPIEEALPTLMPITDGDQVARDTAV